MSQALPMTRARRLDSWFPNGQPKSARQRRQDVRMASRQSGRAIVIHGATGKPTRRPLVHVSLPPERGSIRTHVATYCAPCDRHVRPRLHRHPVGSQS